jgi:hypothetical protein
VHTSLCVIDGWHHLLLLAITSEAAPRSSQSKPCCPIGCPPSNPPPQVLEEEGDELSDIVSAPRMVVTQFLRHHMPTGDVGLSNAQLDSLVVQVGAGGRGSCVRACTCACVRACV